MNWRLFTILSILVFVAFFAGTLRNLTTFAALITVIFVTLVFVVRNTLIEHISESSIVILLVFVINSYLPVIVTNWKVTDGTWIVVSGVVTIVINMRIANYKLLRKAS